MDIIIRDCREEDCASLHRLSRERLGYDYPEDKTREKLLMLLGRPDNRIFVAEADGKVVGYVHAADYDVIYFDSMKNIMGIAVDAEYSRRGIGRKLLEAVELWAAETGAKAIRLNSGSTRTEAHIFYKSCGYESDKTQLRFIKMTSGTK